MTNIIAVLESGSGELEGLTLAGFQQMPENRIRAFYFNESLENFYTWDIVITGDSITSREGGPMYMLRGFTPDEVFEPTAAYFGLLKKNLVYPVMRGVTRIVHELTLAFREDTARDLKSETDIIKAYNLGFNSALKLYKL